LSKEPLVTEIEGKVFDWSERIDFNDLYKLCLRAMMRLLTYNDVFGDHQLRDVIFQECNRVRRTLENGGNVVLDRPFFMILTRLSDEEPMSVAVNWELRYMRKALSANSRPEESDNRGKGPTDRR
jgi:hypothetical protein